ncbi:MAG: maleylpyruvate isomerase family mycothiol-dependent enzyme [Streptosporangiaceae bacterium]
MSGWDATSYDAKDNLLRVLCREAEALFELAEASDSWDAPTACPLWEVRDVVGHLIDVTESYLTGFDAAQSGAVAADPLGLAAMAEHLDEGAKAHRYMPRGDAMDLLRSDFAKMVETCEALGPGDWAGLTVRHTYLGPLPACFYPVLQLMDYAVHGWDIRQGAGRARGLAGEAADLLAPFVFTVWQATGRIPADTRAYAVGVRVLGGNAAADYLVSIAPEGLSYAQQDVSGLPAVIEFDAGSLVLTAFGRVNAGTVRGDRALAEAFLNSFVRI